MRHFLTSEFRKNENEHLSSPEQVISEIYELAYTNGYAGNLWHCLLADALISDVNPYTLSVERRIVRSGGLREAVLTDLEIFHRLFRIDLDMMEREYKQPAFRLLKDHSPAGSEINRYSEEITGELRRLSISLAEAKDAEALRDRLEEFYMEYGVGDFGLHNAFRLGGSGDFGIRPVHCEGSVTLDELVGYEEQKRQLVENTEAFVRGGRGNNCLLYGEAGTGKSTSIRALLNMYYHRGLRMIEVYKHQYKDLNSLIEVLKTRNYKFIIYLDDLSFEEFEIEYKYLKALIEGGLEARPANVLIYATSNRRHLVKESFADRPDSPIEKHKNETVQEKLSLYSRFGVTIYYPSPVQKEFFRIVDELADRCGLGLDKEELHLMANKWEMNHSGLSGRAAAQFIDHLKEKPE